MTERLPSFQPESPFAFPGTYNATEDSTLLFIDNRRYSSGVPSDLTFSPRQAIHTWAKSHPGGWQNRQDARYSDYHRKLKSKFIPKQFKGREDDFRINLLKKMVENESPSNDDPAYIDFHPIGHMARVAVLYDDTLLHTLGTLGNNTPDLRHLDASRHGLALHDIAESEDPIIAFRNDYTIGDISAHSGKTDEQRAQERRIFIDLISNIDGISEHYSEELREMITKLVSHEFKGESKEFVLTHDMMEFTHHKNSLKTALFEARNGNEPQADARYANFKTLLAERSLVLLNDKFEELFDRSPELILPHRDEISLMQKELEEAVHCRDENKEWTKWRSKPKIVKKFGEYEKWRF